MDATLILVLLALGLVYAPRFPRVTFHYLAEHPRPWTVRAREA